MNKLKHYFEAGGKKTIVTQAGSNDPYILHDGVWYRVEGPCTEGQEIGGEDGEVVEQYFVNTPLEKWRKWRDFGNINREWLKESGYETCTIFRLHPTANPSPYNWDDYHKNTELLIETAITNKVEEPKPEPLQECETCMGAGYLTYGPELNHHTRKCPDCEAPANAEITLSKTETVEVLDSEAIHNFFSLSYASYLVLPRVALQSMPEQWQRDFVKLVKQIPETLPEYESMLPESYQVSCKNHNGKFVADKFPPYRRGREKMQSNNPDK